MNGHKIAVVTDSTAYIPKELSEPLGIQVIPQTLIWGNETFLDGVTIDPPAFYGRLREDELFPTTSQPSAGEFVEFFQKLKTDTIVAPLISSELSGTVASAQAAQELLPHLTIKVIDSRSTSMGLGFIVLAAARAAVVGKPLEEVVAAAEEMIDRVHVIFTVDTLEYLYRGGRIGGGKRFLGTALSIKPLLHLEDGHIEALTQVRTKRKAVERMLEIAEERLGTERAAEMAVIYVDARAEGEELAQRARDRFGLSQVYLAEASPVIGTHTGPGTVGVAFYAATSG